MMIWASRIVDLVVIANLLIPASNAIRLANRAEQNLDGRSTYQGGWPLAAASCPAEASVACFTDGGINPTCCPNGQTCFGSTTPYCCPSETDCASHVNNLPVCASSTWDMYGQDDNSKFFCCQSGQLAVDAATGYTGICEGSDQVVPVSLRATMVSQIGGTSVPPYRSYVTGAAASGTNSPATTKSASGAATKSASATETLLNSPASGTASVAGAAVTTAIRLGLGATVGIAVGGCLVILAILSLAIWCCCCRGRRRQPHKEAYGTQEPYNTAAYPPQQMHGAPPTPQQMYSPMPTYHSPPYDPNAQRGFSPGTEFKAVSPHVTQTPVEERPSTFGRSEM